tara:strand:- start:190 stop:438 length:249 start_codon:yes stop_codon:yes gene_type:complete
MVLTKKFKAFDGAILDLHPDLKEVPKPNDHYPELDHILKNRTANLPAGSLNTKVIIMMEKLFKACLRTPLAIFSRYSQNHQM